MDIATYALAKSFAMKYTDNAVLSIAEGLKYRGSVETEDDLPSNPQMGDMYTILADGHEWVWDGSEWVDLFMEVRNCLKVTGGEMQGLLTLLSECGTTRIMPRGNIDLSLGNCFVKEFTDDDSLVIRHAQQGKFNYFILKLINAGAYEVDFMDEIHFEGGIPPKFSENGVDILTFISTDGEEWYCQPWMLGAV